MSQKSTAKKICKIVKEAGGEAWYVGGYVRDRLLGKTPKDIDLEVYNIAPDYLPQLLIDNGVNVRAVGRSFPVWTTDDGVDIALPRVEVGDGLHHADNVRIKYDATMPVSEAMKRRDLTINTFMRCGAGDGRLVYCKGAMDDLRYGIIRHQNEKFAEDPLRVFRAARFAAQLDFLVHLDTIELCKKIDTSQLSKERVWGETKLALMSDVPSRFFRVLNQMGQLHYWFPELEACVGVEQPSQFHPEGEVFEHLMLALDYAAQHHTTLPQRLAVLCHDLGKATTKTVENGRILFRGHAKASVIATNKMLARLGLRDIEFTTRAIERHMDIYNLEANHASQKTYNKLFDYVDPAYCFLEVSIADRNGRELPMEVQLPHETQDAYNRWMKYKKESKGQEVTGADLIALGYEPGTYFSPALDLAHKLWLAMVPKREALPQVEYILKKERNKRVKIKIV